MNPPSTAKPIVPAAVPAAKVSPDQVDGVWGAQVNGTGPGIITAIREFGILNDSDYW